jgi:hypothetical protein
MALTKASLSGKIKTQIQALYGPADDGALLTKFCDAVAQAVVDEIQQNAVITFAPGDIPVQVNVTTGVGANTAGSPLTTKVS